MRKSERFSERALRDQAAWIIGCIKREFVNQQGLLVGGGTDVTTEQSTIIDDLGDFLPMLAYFGEEEIADIHFSYLEQSAHSLVFQEAFKYTDLIFGLLWYARVGVQRERALTLAKKVMDRCITSFFTPSMHSFNGYKRAPSLLQVIDTSDSTFIEVFSEYASIMQEPMYQERADQVLKLLVEHTFFKQHHVLPMILSPRVSPRMLGIIFGDKARHVRLMKQNTNFGFGVAELARHSPSFGSYRKVFADLISGIETIVREPGSAHNLISEQGDPELLTAFSLIDLYMEGHAVFAVQEYLEQARKTADYWLKHQSPTTGLFPKRIGAQETYLDSETDMAIALFRLSEVSGEQKYFTAAERVLAGVWAHHRGSRGYILEVDVDSGKPLFVHYKTKYLALSLKPIIYLLESDTMESSEVLRVLMKDR